jgi:ABC-type bacteriocin/lantibiotic exporter with double-glycine peptidase domain
MANKMIPEFRLFLFFVNTFLISYYDYQIFFLCCLKLLLICIYFMILSHILLKWSELECLKNYVDNKFLFE